MLSNKISKVLESVVLIERTFFFRFDVDGVKVVELFYNYFCKF